MAVVVAGAAAAGGAVASSESHHADATTIVSLTVTRTVDQTEPGGRANAFVTLSDLGDEAGRGGVLTFTAPEGLTFKGLLDLGKLRPFDSDPGAWHCSPQTPTETVCEDATSVRPGSTQTLLVQYAVAEDAELTHPVLNVDFQADDAPERSAKVSFIVAPGHGKPVLFAELGGTANLAYGAQAAGTVDILNVGSLPATSIELTDLVPAIAGHVEGSGAGWACSGSTCSTRADLPVGALAPRLTVHWKPDANELKALDLKPGGAPARQSWTISASAEGGADPVTFTAPGQIELLAPAGAQLDVKAFSPKGHLELFPGTGTTVRVQTTNVGQAATEGALHLVGTIPASFTLLDSSGPAGWTCTADAEPTGGTRPFRCDTPTGFSLAPDTGTALDLQLEALPDAQPGRGEVGVVVEVANETVAEKLHPASLPVEVLEPDAGIPAIVVLQAAGAGELAPVTNGSGVSVLTGQAFSERLDLTNAGGADIAADARAILVQPLGPTVEVEEIVTPHGWRCTHAAQLTCELHLAEGLKPAATIEGPTVRLLAAHATAAHHDYPVRVHLEGPHAPVAKRTPVLVSITKAEAVLVPNLTLTEVPTAGGHGSITVDVANHGTIATTVPVELGLHAPHGATFTELGATGWHCTLAPSATSAHCVAAAHVEQGEKLAQLHGRLHFEATTEGQPLQIGATASEGSANVAQPVHVTIPVIPRHHLRAVIKRPERVVFDDVPPTSLDDKPTPTEVELLADGSQGSGLAVTYRWTQRCTTHDDAAAEGSHCKGVTPAVKWLTQAPEGHPSDPNIIFEAPLVEHPTALVLELEVADGSATSKAWTEVEVLPLPKPDEGFDLLHPKVSPEHEQAPAFEVTEVPAPAEPLAETSHTTQRHTAVATIVATGATANAATAAAASATPAAVSTEFCNLVDSALSSGSLKATVGGVSVNFGSVSVEGAGKPAKCTTGVTVKFAHASFGLDGVSISDLSGSIGSGGVSFSSGTVHVPASWRLPSVSVGSSGLHIGFGGSLEGSLKASGFAFVPLPGGWHGSTTLSFGSGRLSVDTTATGPARDASPGSPAPKAEIKGSIGSDGTFSLDFSIAQMVQLEGAAIDVKGKAALASPGGSVAYSLEGALTAPVKIVGGVSVETMAVKLAPTEQSLGLTGNGTLRLSVPAGHIDLNVDLAYSDPKDFALTVKGGGSASWQPLPGLTIAPSDFSGAIAAKNNKYEFTLKAAVAAPWKVNDNVTLSGLALNLSNVCPRTGAACPPGAAIFLDATGKGEFRLPDVGTIHADAAGSLALPGGEFSVAAKLPSAVSIGSGFSIDTAEVTVQKGMPVLPERPTADQTPGGVRVDITGAITVPKIGRLPTVHAAFSSKGWALAMPFGSFAIPGASGDGSQMKAGVLGWSSFAGDLEVTDPATKQRYKLKLPAKKFVVTADFATPRWVSSILNLPADVKGRLNGTLDPASDTYALRMEFVLPGQVYLYGNASSATSVQVKTTFFEVLRNTTAFEAALGGTASMRIAGSNGTPPSELDMQLRLAYSPVTTNVAGSLSVSSGGGWRNALGVNDLTVYDLQLAFGFNLTTKTPSLGFAATASLPGTITRDLGMLPEARISVTANLSITNPCAELQVVDPSGTGRDVMSLANGSLAAKTLRIVVAPTGCTVGTLRYDPGIDLAFDGRVASLNVSLKAKLQLAPFGFDAKGELGEITLGGVTLKRAGIDVAASPGKVAVTFRGGVEVLGSNVDISGSIRTSGTSFTTEFRGRLDKLSLANGAVTADSLDLLVRQEISPKTLNVEYTGSGNIQLFGSTAKAKFNLSIANGQLNAAVADVVANVKIKELQLDGTFKLDYAKTRPLAVDANAVAFVSGKRIGAATVTLRPGYLQVQADVNVNGVFSAKVDGSAYWGQVPSGATITLYDGKVVPAKTGDFAFLAKDVTLNLGTFKGIGSVFLSNAGGGYSGALSTEIQVVGTGSANTVKVAGSFDADGNFTLEGKTALDLAGFKPLMAVKVVKGGATTIVTGSGSVTAGGSSIDLAGEFKKNGGEFQYRLNGAGNLAVAGYPLSNAKVKLSNFPEDAGFTGDVNLRSGSAVNVNGRLSFDPTGRFWLDTAADIDIKPVRFKATVKFQNFDDQCVLRLRPFGLVCTQGPVSTPRVAVLGTMSVAKIADFYVDLRVNADGSFSATARTPAAGFTELNSSDVNLGVVKGYLSARYYLQLNLQSSSPYFSIEGKGEFALKVSFWKVTSWSGRESIGVGARFSTQPTKFCGSTTIPVVKKNIEACVSA